jgi:HlyD family secretion protein
MKKRILAVLALALVVGAAAWFQSREKDTGAGDRIKVSGNIEITEVALSFKIPGRVVARSVSEGDTVRREQQVARLDPAELEHEAALREAEKAAAEARLGEMLAGYRAEEIAQAQAALARAETRTENAREDFERQQRLYREKVIAKKVYDNAQTAYRVAVQDREEARERLAMLEKGYREEQVAAARAEVERADAALALARTRLRYAELLSPLQGIVLSENVEPGEYVNPGTPVVTVGDLSEVWLRAYINETDLGRVKRGQRALITTDTYPDRRYEGRITFIADEAEFTPKMVQTDRQRVKLMYRVKITAANPDAELKPGMPADAFIILENSGEN